MKYVKRISLMLAMLSLLICIINVGETYAKYKDDITSTSTINIARWKIIVNDIDIRNNSELSNIITPVFQKNDNIAEGVIAPTSVGYFDLNIDCSSVDVSFIYEITTSKNNDDDSVVNDLIVTGYRIIDTVTESTLDEDELYDSNLITQVNNVAISGEVDRNNRRNLYIRVYIEWNDNEDTQSMDNHSDTNASLYADNYNDSSSDIIGYAKMNVNLKFIQKK